MAVKPTIPSELISKLQQVVGGLESLQKRLEVREARLRKLEEKPRYIG
jgi:hypothetical protein